MFPIDYLSTNLIHLRLLGIVVDLLFHLVVYLLSVFLLPLFLPPLESGDTVQTVTSAYVQEFNRDVNCLLYTSYTVYFRFLKILIIVPLGAIACSTMAGNRMVSHTTVSYTHLDVYKRQSQRNYMPGKEFGTARFENPKQVNKILADKDENFNRILSQNVKMSLDFRRLKDVYKRQEQALP